MRRLLVLLALYLGALIPANATISCSLPFTLTNGTLADATQVMANYNALVTCFTQAASAGSNSDITSLNGLTTPLTPGQGGSNVFIGGTSSGAANVQTIATTTPNTFTLTNGYRVIFTAGFTNTGATTLTVGSTAAKNVYRRTIAGPVPLIGNEIVAGQLVEVWYDGTQYELSSMLSGLSGGFGYLSNLASGATTDLGLIPSHNINITGVTGISSFGSSASTTFPIYRLTFAGTLTLTHNATSLILPGTANITTAQNDTAFAMYLGAGNWQVISYSKANGTAVVNPTPLCGAVGLTLSAVGSTLNIAYAADQAVLINPTGNVPIYTTAVSGTINTSTGTVTPTADGMDGEATPTSAWGHIYLISNGTLFNGLVSTSATSPSMPAGYTYRCRVGAMRYSAASQLMAQKASGSHMNYFPTAATNTLNFPIVVSTSAQAWPTTLSLSSQIPPTATRVRLVLSCTTNCAIALSSSSQTNGHTPFSATNPSECFYSDSNSIGFICELPLNGSTNVFIGATNTGTWSVAVAGWRDKVNAN